MEDLKSFIQDEERMANAWNNAVSKNLPEGADTSESDFYECLNDSIQAVNLEKIIAPVMYALYYFDHDEVQKEEDQSGACADLIDMLKEFHQEAQDEGRGGQDTVLGKIVDKLGVVQSISEWLGGGKSD